MESNISNNISEIKENIGYKDVFRQREYLKMIAANLINRFGDSIDAIAMTWVVYVITGSASWSALVYALNRIPSIIVQPLAGPLVEKLNKKVIMIITDVLRGCFVGLFALLYILGILEPWMIAVLSLCISTAEAFRMPAGMAFIRQIIDMKYFTYASSLNSTACTITELIGMGTAGVIIASFGIGTAIGIDAITFFASSLIIGCIKPIRNLKKPEIMNKVGCDRGHTGSSKNQLHEYMSTLKEGFAYIKNVEVIRNFCIMAVLTNAVLVPYSALQSPLVSEVLKQGSNMLSILGISLSIGMAVGAVIFPYLRKRFSPLKLVSTGGIVTGTAYGGLIIGSFFPHNMTAVLGITILSSLFMGIGIAFVSSVVSVQFMKAVSEDYMARVGAIFNALGTSAMPVVSFIISITASFLNTRIIILASGTICVIIFLYIGIRKVKME